MLSGVPLESYFLDFILVFCGKLGGNISCKILLFILHLRKWVQIHAGTVAVNQTVHKSMIMLLTQSTVEIISPNQMLSK